MPEPCPEIDRIAAWLRMDRQGSPELQAHIENCSSCQAIVKGILWAEASQGSSDSASAPPFASAAASETPRAARRGTEVMADPKHPGEGPSGPPDAEMGPADVRRLGRFHIQEVLGQGGFGVVYRAFDPVLARPVALKVPKLRDGNASHVERFLREARAAARLRHPNIVAVYDCDREGNQPFIALEFVPGQTLAERLRTGRPSLRQAAQWAKELALALHYAHREAIVHRDVKPGNILIDSSGAARLMDFGLAKETVAVAVPIDDDAEAIDDPALTRCGAIVGTPAYMSPEQARGDAANIGPASDQYSLGLVLFEMTTGRRPYSGNVDDILDKTADLAHEVPAPRQFDRNVSIGLEAIVRKALRKNPNERYSDAAAMAVDLTRWLRGDAVGAEIRVRGKLVRRCPGCERLHAPEKRVCVFCGESLADLEPTDSADYQDPIHGQESIEEPPSWLDRIAWCGEQLRSLPVWIYAVALVGLIVGNYLLFGKPADDGRDLIVQIWAAIPVVGATRECGMFVFLVLGVLVALWWGKAQRQ